MHEKFQPKEADPVFEKSRKIAKEKLKKITKESFTGFAVRAMNISEFEKAIANGRVEDGKEVYLPNHSYRGARYMHTDFDPHSLKSHIPTSFEDYQAQEAQTPYPGGDENQIFTKYLHQKNWENRVRDWTAAGISLSNMESFFSNIRDYEKLVKELRDIATETKDGFTGKDRRERTFKLMKEKMLKPYRPLVQHIADLQKIYDECVSRMREMGMSDELIAQIQEVLRRAEEQEVSFYDAREELIKIDWGEYNKLLAESKKLETEEDDVWAIENKRLVDSEKERTARGNPPRRNTANKAGEEAYWYSKKQEFLNNLHEYNPSTSYKEFKINADRYKKLNNLIGVFGELTEYLKFKPFFGKKEVARFIECVNDGEKLSQPGAVKDVLKALLQFKKMGKEGEYGVSALERGGQYDVVAVLDISSIGKPNPRIDSHNWGFTHLAEGDKKFEDAAAKILAVVALYGDPTLTEKLIRLSSHAKEAACPVFTSKGTQKFP